MYLTAIALLVTSAAGMLGWYFAWRARGESLDKDEKLMAAAAGESAAKGLVFENNARAAVVTAKLANAEELLVSQQNQLDAERKSRQALVDALAKSGHPVGDAYVDSSLDRLYADGDQGGQGPGSSPGGNSAGLSGQPASAASAPPKG